MEVTTSPFLARAPRRGVFADQAGRPDCDHLVVEGTVVAQTVQAFLFKPEHPEQLGVRVDSLWISRRLVPEAVNRRCAEITLSIPEWLWFKAYRDGPVRHRRPARKRRRR